VEKEIDPDKIYYGVADKFLFNKKHPNFVNGKIENYYTKIVHTMMDDKGDLLDYIRSIDRQQANLIKLSDKSDFSERYIVSFTKIDYLTIKIIEVEEHINKFLLLI